MKKIHLIISLWVIGLILGFCSPFLGDFGTVTGILTVIVLLGAIMATLVYVIEHWEKMI